jgi:Tfp pilus assembly protein PilN
MEQFLPLIVGFLLTTVAGGVLGYFFQSRSWSHQYDAQFREQERERAAKAFDEISRLLDKRLYRLRQLYWQGPAEVS